MSARRIAVVGQAPGRRSGAGDPFDGPSGERLARICGLESRRELSERVDLYNLCDCYPGPSRSGEGDAFVSTSHARFLARGMGERLRSYETVLLCGRHVATAFDRGREPFLIWYPLVLWCGRSVSESTVRAATVPHPSGISRWWNDAARHLSAREFMLDLMPPSLSGRGRP